MRAVTIGSCGVVRTGGGYVTRWGIKVYEASLRKKDNVAVWRLVEILHTVTGRTLSKKTEQLALDMAKQRKLPFIQHLTHNSTQGISALELLAAAHNVERVSFEATSLTVSETS